MKNIPKLLKGIMDSYYKADPGAKALVISISSILLAMVVGLILIIAI